MPHGEQLGSVGGHAVDLLLAPSPSLASAAEPRLALALGAAALLAGLLCAYLWSSRQYWRRRGVPTAPAELLFGSARRLLFIQESLPVTLHRVFQQLEGHAFGGFYMMTTPSVLIRDPRLVRRVLVADHAHFYDRGSTLKTKADPLTDHLWTLGGPVWRELRLLMGSSFSAGSTRRTFFMVQDCCRRMQRSVEAALQQRHSRVFELKDLLSTYTTDVIGMCAFGIECGTIDDPMSQFRQVGKMIVETSRLDAFRKVSNITVPTISALLGLKFFSPSVAEFFDSIVSEVMLYREKNGVVRDDLIQLMIKVKEHGLGLQGIDVTSEFLVAQMLMVFTLGFEMTSSTMSFCLHELALNPHVQTRVRLEVDAVTKRHGGQISYEALQEMPYLDLVIKETLRLYPPVGFIIRHCTEPYEVPDSGGVVLPRGTNVYVPLLSLHRDAGYFPEPLRFLPERFQDQPSADAYLPFGDGHRSCLGQAFALVEVKAGLAALLSRFEFQRCSRSAPSPAPIEPRKMIVVAEGGLWVRLKPRTWLPCT